LLKTVPASGLPRTIAPGVEWLGDCLISELKGSPIHIHHSIYLIHGGDQVLMIDTGRPTAFEAMVPEVERILDGRKLDWILPTHPEVNHAANFERWMKRYPEARLVGDLRDFHLFYPEYEDRFVRRPVGSNLDLGRGYRIQFHEAPLKDLPSTQWFFEESQRIMFVADGFAYSHGHLDSPDGEGEAATHAPGECGLFAHELDHEVTDDQVAFIIRSALYWTRFVDLGQLFERVKEQLHQAGAKMIAPAHGNVIADLDAVMPRMEAAHNTMTPVA
jgi:flavorubredoxin